MRIYSNIKECHNETIRNVAELGSIVRLKTYQNIDISEDEDYVTRELIGESFKLLDNVKSEEIRDYIKVVKGESWYEWVEKDFEERISSSYVNPGKAFAFVAPYWDKFMNKLGLQDYTYNERLGRKLEFLIEELRRDPSSRRAFLNIWESGDMIATLSERRVPCSLGYIFLIRSGKLHVTYLMRSSDVMQLLLIDLYMVQRLKEYIAEKLGISLGTTTFFANSLHAYQKDIKAVF
jgi:thymidylate synthase